MAKSTYLSLRVNEAVKTTLQKLAKEADRSVGYVVNMAISDFIARKQAEGDASKRGARR